MISLLAIAFSGMLLALVLSGLTDAIRKALRAPRPLALAAAVIVAAALAAAALWLAGYLIVDNLDAMRVAFAASLQQIRNAPWTALFPELRNLAPNVFSLMLRAGSVLTSTIGGVVGVAVGVFVGICLAAEPERYRDAFVRLFPIRHRGAMRALLDEIGRTLRAWLVARLISMVTLGVLVTIGLSLLHVPYAPALGALAGALAFIPNLGALIAAVPAILLALAIGPERAAFVALMYWLAHAVDDFFVIPVAERRIVKLPPALTILVQLGLAPVAGVAGVALAAPLTAVAIVTVHRLWVERTLERSAPPEEDTSCRLARSSSPSQSL